MIHLKHALAGCVLLTSAIAIAATMSGTPGNDSMRGTDTGDFMRGNDGNDHLFGLGGNDTIFGDAGIDLLNGGPGVNRLVGGTGNDRFDVMSASLTYIDDVEHGEVVNLSCAASWGQPPSDIAHMLTFSNTDPGADLAFRGRDGSTIRFKGLTADDINGGQRVPFLKPFGPC